VGTQRKLWCGRLACPFFQASRLHRNPPSPLDGLPLVLRHIGGVAFDSDEADLPDARRAVGAKDEAEYFGDEVIELSAVLRLLDFRAIGARGIVVVLAAGAHFAPGRFVIFPAARTFLSQISPARAAIQPAGGDQCGIGDDFFHDFLHNVAEVFPPAYRLSLRVRRAIESFGN
jgi:hypothetical protein